MEYSLVSISMSISSVSVLDARPQVGKPADSVVDKVPVSSIGARVQRARLSQSSVRATGNHLSRSSSTGSMSQLVAANTTRAVPESKMEWTSAATGLSWTSPSREPRRRRAVAAGGSRASGGAQSHRELRTEVIHRRIGLVGRDFSNP